MNEQKAIKEGDFQESEKLSREAIAIPIYPELTAEEREFITKQSKVRISATPCKQL